MIKKKEKDHFEFSEIRFGLRFQVSGFRDWVKIHSFACFYFKYRHEIENISTAVKCITIIKAVPRSVRNLFKFNLISGLHLFLCCRISTPALISRTKRRVNKFPPSYITSTIKIRTIYPKVINNLHHTFLFTLVCNCKLQPIS